MSYLKTTNNITDAVDYIKQGRLVAYPTGTSYALAADALQGHALQRLRQLKQRQPDQPFSICLDEQLWPDYLDLTAAELSLLQKNANQPFTLLVKPADSLTHLAQDGLVALRVIDHPIMRQIAEAAGVPLTATSANISGQDPCHTPECIVEKFPGKIDDTTYDLSLAAILDGGELPPSQPTTIAKIVDDKIQILRPGALKL